MLRNLLSLVVRSPVLRRLAIVALSTLVRRWIARGVASIMADDDQTEQRDSRSAWPIIVLIAGALAGWALYQRSQDRDATTSAWEPDPPGDDDQGAAVGQ